MCPKIIFSLLLLWNKAMPTYCSFAIASQSQNRFFTHEICLLQVHFVLSSATSAMADEEDIARLDVKGLIALFGTSTIPRNIDEPSDGVLYVIKDKKAISLHQEPCTERKMVQICCAKRHCPAFV